MVTERGGWTYNSNYGARRTGDDLQHNYTSDHVSWVPVVTGGVGLRHEVNASGNLHGVGAVETGIPLGDGLGTVRAKSGVEFAPAQWVSLEGGLTATGVWATSTAMDFHDVSGMRPGGWAGAQFKLTETVQP